MRTATPEQKAIWAANVAKELVAVIERNGGKARDGFLTNVAIMANSDSSFRSATVEFGTDFVWGSGVSVDLDIRADLESGFYQTKCRAKISWSSTSRSLANATATLAQYQRAVEFAAIAEAMLNA